MRMFLKKKRRWRRKKRPCWFVHILFAHLWMDGMMMTVVDVLKGGWDVLGIELDQQCMRSNNISVRIIYLSLHFT